jgi:aryl-alcohol dehydrogenase-like predicted oxidoreductase
VTAAIVGFRNVAQVDALVPAGSLILTDEDVQTIEE